LYLVGKKSSKLFNELLIENNALKTIYLLRALPSMLVAATTLFFSPHGYGFKGEALTFKQLALSKIQAIKLPPTTSSLKALALAERALIG
jgi:hypothetical protein